MEKGQIMLEFLICFLILTIMLGLMVKTLENNSNRLKTQLKQIRLKVRADELSAYCNLIFLNWNNLKINYSLDLKGFYIDRDRIVLKHNNTEVGTRCFSSSIQLVENKLIIEGIKKWF